MAAGTLIFQGQLQLLLTAEYSLLKGNTDLSTDIGSLHGAVICSSAAAASKEITKDISEDISHIRSGEIKAAKAAASCASLKCRMAKLIVLAAFLRIA